MRFSLAVVVSASCAGLAVAPGAPCGQSSNVVWPGAGGHCASKLVDTHRNAAIRNKSWRTMNLDVEIYGGIVACGVVLRNQRSRDHRPKRARGNCVLVSDSR